MLLVSDESSVSGRLFRVRKMKSTVIWMLFISSVTHVTARIYETADAVIVEGIRHVIFFSKAKLKRSITSAVAMYEFCVGPARGGTGVSR